ncbi:hypothetical protein AGABI1DRAFT_112326 [Agaricus bisporus var. burnettii JB137-S8]|uniref:non-specific serine/threonine protein kinase n=1 Tax=Agaricus bisporus var. burnettii (strain JB137-S8 / ATCC MYA-4627 / FGSC 10392) TaxID=597362 RepID=K5W170_AGABU|nr:uncharacterized protein AGABI1DRAFT_112326 [Agaricus bisporus var. burnettii JB137-S8]EKM80544.1 hypothetical protein AGABI1DRAFT_112326 [Agaricus bisporus var. burnettii JB137-S8]
MTPLPSSEVVGLPASEGKTFFRGTPFDKLGPGNRFQLNVKLATGKNSSIWLTKDIEHSRHVLLKILSGRASDSAAEGSLRHELPTYQRLASLSAEETRHCSRLITHFKHRSPDGEHLCLALELERTNIESVLSAKDPAFYPIPIVKRILRHVLHAITALHKLEIAHTDIKPDNILVSLAPTWSDAKVSEWVSDHPPRLNVSEDFYKSLENFDTRAALAFISEEFPRPTVEELGTCQFKIGGFSKAQDLYRRTTNDIAPLALRPPEVILGYGWGAPVDIWMFGCLVFTLLTKTQLFPDTVPHDITHWYLQPGADPKAKGFEVDYLLFRMENIMEQGFRRDMLAQSCYSDKYFKPNSTEMKRFIALRGLSIEKQIRETERPMSWEDVTAAADFMRRCLKFNPHDRPSARDLLDDPWLKE